MKKVAIIAAHPDDEAFGCGGTILKYKFQQAQIYFLWLTDGVGARSQKPEDLLTRQSGCDKALSFIKPHFYKHENFPDNRLDTVPFLKIVQSVENFLSYTKPDTVFTHFINDLNIDHVLTCRAVMTATRPGSATFVKEIYSFEVASSTEWAVGVEKFTPDTYIDITDYIGQKKQYINCYEEEMRTHPHPRSKKNIIGKNALRGGEVNTRFAESFVTLRRVIND